MKKVPSALIRAAPIKSLKTVGISHALEAALPACSCHR